MNKSDNGTRKQGARRVLRAIVSAPIALLMTTQNPNEYSPLDPCFYKAPFYAVRIDDGATPKKENDSESEKQRIQVAKERRSWIIRTILLCVFAIIVPAIVAGLLLTQAYNCAF